jgi:hypothetical protein
MLCNVVFGPRQVGIFSFLMVGWATTIGCVCGIPDAVMGLTFLAAGASSHGRHCHSALALPAIDCH